jgi:hypothetical protein
MLRRKPEGAMLRSKPEGARLRSKPTDQSAGCQSDHSHTPARQTLHPLSGPGGQGMPHLSQPARLHGPKGAPRALTSTLTSSAASPPDHGGVARVDLLPPRPPGVGQQDQDHEHAAAAQEHLEQQRGGQHASLGQDLALRNGGSTRRPGSVRQGVAPPWPPWASVCKSGGVSGQCRPGLSSMLPRQRQRHQSPSTKG